MLHGAALPAWRGIVEAVHAAGGAIVAQLWHLGPMRLAGTGYHPEAPSCSPSGVWGPTGRRSDVGPAFAERLAHPTRALADAEILACIEAYARSARNAAEVGFDGVEIHGANSYLPDAFLWEGTNLRTDRWGGDRRARSRFAAEVVRAVRGAVGEGVPIFLRFSQWKHQDLDARLAQTPAELAEVLEPLAEAGVDVFDGSQFVFDEPAFSGSHLNLAGWAKQLTGRPSVTGGGVGMSGELYANGGAAAADNLDVLAERFARGEFDLVTVGRPMLQDPDWTRKVRLGLPFDPYDPTSLRALE